MDELKIQNLSYPIGGFILRAHFVVKSGERLALEARSGGGKTSLLRLITGLDPLANDGSNGRIFLGEKELTDLPPEKRQMGYLFQENALFPSLSVLENVVFGLRVRGVPLKKRRELGLEALRKVGLERFSDSSIDHLSGGEKQRVAFLRAWIWKPKVLLLDEPFSALDQTIKESLKKDLLGFLKENPIPLIFVTHDSKEVEDFATQRIHLVEREQGKFREFYCNE